MKTTIKLLIVLTLAVFLIRSSNAQMDLQWEKIYNSQGQNMDMAVGMTFDPLGNIIITGESITSQTDYDYATIKYSPTGTQQWVQRYNGLPGDDADLVNAITSDAVGNIFVTGSSNNAPISGSDIVTIKYNSLGVELRNMRYSSPGGNADIGRDVFVDNSGNIYITGTSYNSNEDIITVKYDSNGTQKWAKVFDASPQDNGYALTVDALGNVYVSGTSGFNTVLIKYSSNGTQLWAAGYNPGNGGTANGRFIAKDGNGNVFLGGTCKTNNNQNDFLVVKYNSSGVEQWVKTFNGPANKNDMLNDMMTDMSGNIYLTGMGIYAGNDTSYTTIKYDVNGVEKWKTKYNGPAGLYDEPSSIYITWQGDIFVTGKSRNNSGKFNIATVKYDQSGSEQWVMIKTGNNNTTAQCVAVDGYSNVIIAGTTSNASTALDFITIKYSPISGIHQVGSENPAKYSLSQNYPNPFNPVTNINFSVPKSGHVSLKVYDISGAEIASLVNYVLQAGFYKYDFDGSHLSSGTYFYKLTTEDFSEVKKMILVK